MIDSSLIRYKNFKTSMISYLNSTINNEELALIKNRFKNEVSSNRRLDYVLNVEDLINLLEKRACLSPDDVNVFQEMASLLNRPDLSNKVREYNEAPSGPSVPPVSSSPQRASRKSAKDVAYDRISKELGRMWKDFARTLGVREGELDSLEERYPSQLHLRVREVLRYHDEYCDPNRWKSGLLDALSEARRNDLRAEVQKILDIHS